MTIAEWFTLCAQGWQNSFYCHPVTHTHSFFLHFSSGTFHLSGIRHCTLEEDTMKKGQRNSTNSYILRLKLQFLVVFFMPSMGSVSFDDWINKRDFTIRHYPESSYCSLLFCRPHTTQMKRHWVVLLVPAEKKKYFYNNPLLCIPFRTNFLFGNFWRQKSQINCTPISLPPHQTLYAIALKKRQNNCWVHKTSTKFYVDGNFIFIQW